MNLLLEIYNTILYKPLFNLLILFYLPWENLGIAILLLTILIRLILWPLLSHSLKFQKTMTELQPKIAEIEKKYKADPERKIKETLALYKKEKINPLNSFFPILIQLPILIALYQVFWKGFQPDSINNLYSFLPKPENINPLFLGKINLASPDLILAFLAGSLQFFQTKMVSPKTKKISDKFSEMFQKQMLYFFPIFTILILMKLPSAIALYWATNSLFSIIQQYLVSKKV